MELLARIRESASLVARRVATGAQAGNWGEAEVVLASLLLFYGDPSRLGGTRSTGTSRQHPAVVLIARLIGRTEGAVVLKVMNLRFVRTGGARGTERGSKKMDPWAVHSVRQLNWQKLATDPRL